MNTVFVKPSVSAENRTREITELLRTCPDDTVVSFEKGVYDFYADGCDTAYYCPACNQSGDKRVIFPVLRKKNITIDGNGSDFIFHDRVFPFLSQFCDGVTLKNFTVNFSFLRYCTAEAVCDDSGMLLRLDKALWGCRANEKGNLLFTAGDTAFSTGEKVYFMQQGNAVCYLAAGMLYYAPENMPAGVMYCHAEEREDGIYLRYSGKNTSKPFVNGSIVINYDEDRQNDVFFFDRCKNVVMENVTVYRGAGMGIVTQLCENVELDGIRYLRGVNDDEVYSTTADGLFFTNDSGRVWVHNCHIKGTMDDAVSIHGIYAKVEKLVTDTKVLLRYQHKSHSGYNPYYRGDTLVITDGETYKETGRCTVKSSYMGNDTYTVLVEFTEPVTEILRVGDYLENHNRSPEVIIENCVFENFPHIRLASGHKIVFRQNVVKNGNGVLVNDLMRYWYAYGISDDVDFTGNSFINCRVGVRACVERGEDTSVSHGKIRLQKNQFIDCENGILLDSVREPHIVDNSYIRVGNREAVTDCGAVNRNGIPQLLMRRDTPESFPRTPLPEGFRTFVFRRGGDERMSMAEYKKYWFDVVPHWSENDFNHFYNDDRIPEMGHFLVFDEQGNAAGHSNVQLNEHKPGSATVHFVDVRPDYRGKRLGYIVSEQVLDYVEKHNIPVTYLTTDEFRVPALKIYLKLGFRPVVWDKDIRDRWLPILHILGYNEWFDAERGETLVTIGE